MSSDPERGMGTYLSSGIAMDFATGQLKGMNDLHKRNIVSIKSCRPVTRTLTLDAVKRLAAGFYFSFPRSIFWSLTVLGVALGYLLCTFGYITIFDVSL